MLVQAKLDNVYKFIGGAEGIIDAIESPGFKGDFTDHILNRLRTRFRTDAIALSGTDSLKHVFEWGPQSGGVATGSPSSIPLFRLTKSGSGGNKLLSYHFVPSTHPVPLPDPSVYGFPAEKLEHMTRHVFKYKAIIMESGAPVTITHKWSEHGLFIPTTRSDKGYIMTKKKVVINPGGSEATGGFSQFWSQWFETEAPVIIKKESQLTEDFIAKTGRRVFRNLLGRFASGNKQSVAYVSSAKRTAELAVLTASKRYLSDGPIEWENE